MLDSQYGLRLQVMADETGATNLAQAYASDNKLHVLQTDGD